MFYHKHVWGQSRLPGAVMQRCRGITHAARADFGPRNWDLPSSEIWVTCTAGCKLVSNSPAGLMTPPPFGPCFAELDREAFTWAFTPGGIWRRHVSRGPSPVQQGGIVHLAESLPKSRKVDLVGVAWGGHGLSVALCQGDISRGTSGRRVQDAWVRGIRPEAYKL
jgi:hypothetical protein